jgi:hypothetical protein
MGSEQVDPAQFPTSDLPSRPGRAMRGEGLLSLDAVGCGAGTFINPG